MSEAASEQKGARKIDFKKQDRYLYNPPIKEAEMIDIPALPFLMIDGMGDPNTAHSYQEAVEALYNLAYGLKFQIRKEAGLDYTVMPLEGLWWTPDMRDFSVDHKELWHWTLLIRQPHEVSQAHLELARSHAASKKPSPALVKLRLEIFHEGLAAQIMHIGPYSTEAPTVARLHTFIEEQGYTFTQKHHEIYLSDPRRADPTRMRTILRQPMLQKQ
ncbi:MAG TPA: GyrI-like domain-containing protein [Ktedonobacteraceae bacterium]|nr:GyrI-like domain-containing protein [Ktedonobacteraceae bacterium]